MKLVLCQTLAWVGVTKLRSVQLVHGLKAWLVVIHSLTDVSVNSAFNLTTASVSVRRSSYL